MSSLSMKELLEAGVHFGHRTHRWNPKMKKYIYGGRNGIYIIDLHQTVKLFDDAQKFVQESVLEGNSILFVGTKKQAQEAIEQAAKACGMYYVNQRWLGGMLTNFKTIQNRIARLKEIEKMEEDGRIEQLTKKEASKVREEYQKLQKYLGGIKDMQEMPGVMYIVDLKKERIALLEAKKLGIPVVAIVDTNCDPEEVDYVIPGNDDAIRAIKLISGKIAEAVNEVKAPEEELEVAEETAQANEDETEEKPNVDEVETAEANVDENETLEEDDSPFATEEEMFEE
ncbi:MAG: 30S ribosomal protein S2 [Armatimonadota bacterium]